MAERKKGGKIEKSIDILKHELVPQFKILSENEKKRILEKFGVSEEQLPKILETDPVTTVIKAKAGDLIEIKRKSTTAGDTVYYRIVKKA